MDLLIIILVLIQIIIYILTALIALLYACLILFIRRLRHKNNIFIANICLSIILSSIYFIIFFQGYTVYNSQSLCILFYFTFHIACIDIPFAFLAFTVHRFCSITFHTKDLFKKKRWVVICIFGHWIVECIISLPFINEYDLYCNMKLWIGYYAFITTVIIPSFINITLNIRIFLHVRNSVRRIHPELISRTIIGTNNQQLKMNRRDLSLLKHMIFTFLVFIIGWSPIMIANIVELIILNQLVAILACMYVSAFATLAIIIYLFLCNPDIRQYIYQNIRRCFHV